MRSVSILLPGACFIGMVAAGDIQSAGDAEAAQVKLPLCVGCHGARGEGREPAGGLPAYPALAGQIEAYLVKAMTAYKNDQRVDPMMGAIAKALTNEDIANLAAYYATLER
jgi:cytochrome c553